MIKQGPNDSKSCVTLLCKTVLGGIVQRKLGGSNVASVNWYAIPSMLPCWDLFVFLSSSHLVFISGQCCLKKLTIEVPVCRPISILLLYIQN